MLGVSINGKVEDWIFKNVQTIPKLWNPVHDFQISSNQAIKHNSLFARVSYTFIIDWFSFCWFCWNKQTSKHFSRKSWGSETKTNKKCVTETWPFEASMNDPLQFPTLSGNTWQHPPKVHPWRILLLAGLVVRDSTVGQYHLKHSPQVDQWFCQIKSFEKFPPKPHLPSCFYWSGKYKFCQEKGIFLRHFNQLIGDWGWWLTILRNLIQKENVRDGHYA